MKIRFFSVLAVTSLLSLGVIAGCSNPCAAKTKTSASTSTEAKANPCASKANPCASKANPCASKANPCASKANPCASKAASIGAPLAQELQGKPVIVDVFATWCSACKNIAPTLSQLKKDYDGKANFVVLDVSDRATSTEAEAKANQLGLSKFLAENKAQTGLVAIIDPATGKILAQHRNNPNVADYTTVLNAAIPQ
ncbi:thioredoxin family protein [Leptolyngbya sp. FACHB-1624]|uniref:TlpA family protein disulfide reductase n=1 Tax=Leptolyngbya sp. FACHB-1624 TaxID=2692802 RepID=UPI001689F187|nr:thioredoxin family protein [Leptolyngbya sp. FACHB-1624]MBD1854741.1 thioredoxin family protein [Leptolyngbya sp. FACHB-1624]